MSPSEKSLWNMMKMAIINWFSKWKTEYRVHRSHAIQVSYSPLHAVTGGICTHSLFFLKALVTLYRQQQRQHKATQRAVWQQHSQAYLHSSPPLTLLLCLSLSSLSLSLSLCLSLCLSLFLFRPASLPLSFTLSLSPSIWFLFRPPPPPVSLSCYMKHLRLI